MKWNVRVSVVEVVDAFDEDEAIDSISDRLRAAGFEVYYEDSNAFRSELDTQGEATR